MADEEAVSATGPAEGVADWVLSALEELQQEVLALVERLDDLALEVLRDAAASGAERRPEVERRLTRARHALERAVGLLQR